MLDVLASDAVQAGRDLAVAGLVYLAYKIARDAAQGSGRVPALLKGAGVVIVLGAIAALMVGNGSCGDSEPMFGYCSQSEGGFAPSIAQRAATFLYWLILFGVPVVMGAMAARVDPLNPWGKPKPKAP
mgnify:CR=1 FL=1